MLQSQGAETQQTTALIVRSHYDFKSPMSGGGVPAEKTKALTGIAGIQVSKSEPQECLTWLHEPGTQTTIIWKPSLLFFIQKSPKHCKSMWFPEESGWWQQILSSASWAVPNTPPGLTRTLNLALTFIIFKFWKYSPGARHWCKWGEQGAVWREDSYLCAGWCVICREKSEVYFCST